MATYSPTMLAFLKQVKHDVERVLNNAEKDEDLVLWHLVIGNEAADLDSVIASITHAFHLYQQMKNTKTDIFVPIVNIPADDFSLRTEIVAIFQRLSFPAAQYLVFRESFQVLVKKKRNLRITLVDHNALPETLIPLHQHVTAVIDHHADSGSFDDPYISKKIEPVGSCCTLIAESIYNQNEELFTEYPVAEMLLSAILLDTVNLSTDVGRVTEKDVEFAEELQLISRFSAKELFDIAQQAKFDMSSLPCSDVLRKDFKMTPCCSPSFPRVGVSSLTLSLDSFTQKEHWLEDTASFLACNSLDVLLLMFIHREAELTIRELMVYAQNASLKEEFCDYLMKISELHLSEIHAQCEDSNVEMFRQGQVKISRKLLMPYISSFCDEISNADDFEKDKALNVQKVLEENDNGATLDQVCQGEHSAEMIETPSYTNELKIRSHSIETSIKCEASCNDEPRSTDMDAHSRDHQWTLETQMTCNETEGSFDMPASELNCQATVTGDVFYDDNDNNETCSGREYLNDVDRNSKEPYPTDSSLTSTSRRYSRDITRSIDDVRSDFSQEDSFLEREKPAFRRLHQHQISHEEVDRTLGNQDESFDSLAQSNEHIKQLDQNSNSPPDRFLNSRNSFSRSCTTPEKSCQAPDNSPQQHNEVLQSEQLIDDLESNQISIGCNEKSYRHLDDSDVVGKMSYPNVDELQQRLHKQDELEYKKSRRNSNKSLPGRTQSFQSRSSSFDGPDKSHKDLGKSFQQPDKLNEEIDRSIDQPSLEFEDSWNSQLYQINSSRKTPSGNEEKHRIMIRDLSFDESNSIPDLFGIDLLCPVFLAVTEDDDDDAVLKDIRRKTKSIEDLCSIIPPAKEEFPLRRTKSELPRIRRRTCQSKKADKSFNCSERRGNSRTRQDSIQEEETYVENPFAADQYSDDENQAYLFGSSEGELSNSRDSSDWRSSRSFSDPMRSQSLTEKIVERFSFSEECLEMYETHEDNCDCDQCLKPSTSADISIDNHITGQWNRFITVSVGDALRVVDLGLIEPYVKVISHGGFYEVGDERRIVMVFTAAFLPPKFIPKYNIVMEQLFYYVVHTLDLCVTDCYDIVYFNDSGPNMPGRDWLKKCYDMVARRLKKNLKSLYLVHPNFWLKAMVRFYQPFISSKFFKKVRFIKSLRMLKKHISLEYIFLPDDVKRADPDSTYWLRN